MSTIGVQFLRRSYEMGAIHPVTQFFLAEAILDYEPQNTAEARRLLEKCAAGPPRPGTTLEASQYARLSRKRLDELKPAAN